MYTNEYNTNPYTSSSPYPQAAQPAPEASVLSQAWSAYIDGVTQLWTAAGEAGAAVFEGAGAGAGAALGGAYTGLGIGTATGAIMLAAAGAFAWFNRSAIAKALAL